MFNGWFYHKVGFFFKGRLNYMLVIRKALYMHANTNKRKAGVAILISDKVDFRERNIAKDKEGPFITLMCH